MPQLIDPIDRIARKKQRDVVFVTFHEGDHYCSQFDWENCSLRQQTLHWLETQAIPYEACFPMWHDGLLECPYQGQLYIDVPYDRNDPLYSQRVISKTRMARCACPVSSFGFSL